MPLLRHPVVGSEHAHPGGDGGGLGGGGNIGGEGGRAPVPTITLGTIDWIQAMCPATRAYTPGYCGSPHVGEPVPQEASAVPLRPAMSKNSTVRFRIAEGSALDTQYSPGVRVGREQTGGGNAGGVKHNNSSEQASDTLPTSGETHCCAAGNYTSLTLIQVPATRVLRYNLCGTCCTCVLRKGRHVM